MDLCFVGTAKLKKCHLLPYELATTGFRQTKLACVIEERVASLSHKFVASKVLTTDPCLYDYNMLVASCTQFQYPRLS